MKKQLTLLFLFLSLISFGQRESFDKVNLEQLIQETQLNVGNSDSLKIFWWIPIEFWRVTLVQDENMTEQGINDFLSVLDQYAILAVVEGRMGAFGGVQFTPADSIRKNTILLSSDNISHKSIPESELSVDVTILINTLKPIMINLMGNLGQNMQFLVFDDRDEKGKRIFDPYKENSIKLKVRSSMYEWDTALGALLKKKICPIDDEALNGKWNFCPVHGEKLKKIK